MLMAVIDFFFQEILAKEEKTTIFICDGYSTFKINKQS